jgi:glyceraldehyde 3-phosphate dehydrogenase
VSIKVGINGMGRIGRAYLRCSLDDPDIEVVAVNDITDGPAIARLLRYDSTFGPLGYPVEAADSALTLDGRKIAVTAVRDPAQLRWAEQGADIVIEATGKFRTRAAAAAHHIFIRAGLWSGSATGHQALRISSGLRYVTEVA